MTNTNVDQTFDSLQTASENSVRCCYRSNLIVSLNLPWTWGESRYKSLSASDHFYLQATFVIGSGDWLRNIQMTLAQNMFEFTLCDLPKTITTCGRPRNELLLFRDVTKEFCLIRRHVPNVLASSPVSNRAELETRGDNWMPIESYDFDHENDTSPWLSEEFNQQPRKTNMCLIKASRKRKVADKKWKLKAATDGTIYFARCTNKHPTWLALQQFLAANSENYCYYSMLMRRALVFREFPPW